MVLKIKACILNSLSSNFMNNFVNPLFYQNLLKIH